MKIEEFIKEVEKLTISCDQIKLNQLKSYYEFLNEYNSHTNLTAIIEEDDVYLKHFYDSLTVCNVIDFNNISSVIDIGSGAGFPGIVLKIFFPHLNLTVLDSNNKKTTFISQLVEKLQLDGVKVINARAEDYAKDNLNCFDLCVSRAVAYIDIITELSKPFIKKSGKIVLMKGDFINEEPVLKHHYKDLDIENYSINKIELPNKDVRNLVVLEKFNETKKVLTYSQIIKRNKKWSANK